MAFITKHTSSLSCSFFLTATLVLSLMMAHHASSAPFTGCQDDVSTDAGSQEHIEQVFGGLEILIGLGSRLNETMLNIQEFQSVNISLQMVCNMYNLYTHFTTLHMFSTVFPESGPRIDYTSRQFVAWKVMHSACQWAIASGSGSGSSPLTDCNFHSIASTCYSFNHRRLVFEDRFEVGCAAQQRVPIAAQQWINKNEVPQAVADYISNIM